MTDTADAARERFERFADTLATYDDPRVERLREAIAKSDVMALRSPNLLVDEWVDVLEVLAGEAYLSAYDRERWDGEYHETQWYLRHDGEAYIYGIENTGELYRGDDALRQIRAVIEHHDVYARPMETYPLDEE